MPEADTKDAVPTEADLRGGDVVEKAGGAWDIDRLIKDASGLNQMNVDVPGLQRDLAAVAKAKGAASAASYWRQRGHLDEDRERMVKALDKTAIGPDELRPWDEKKERAARNTPPLEAFGSLASAFALVASAFTHQPLINGLNGAAGAMNAIREGDEKAYTSAYDAWKSNTDLAIKRHNIQQQAYTNAGDLMSKDIALGNAEMQANAVKFGDKQVEALIANGMIKEVFDLLQARQTQAMNLLRVMPEVERMMTDNEILRADPRWTDGTPMEKAQAKDDLQAGRMTPDQQVYRQFVRENPESTAEERMEFLQKLRTRRTLTPQQQALETFLEQKPDATAEDIRDFINTFQKGGTRAGADNTKERTIAEMIASGEAKDRIDAERKIAEARHVSTPKPRDVAIQEEKDRAKAKGEEITTAEAIRRVASASQTITGNRADDLRRHVSQYQESLRVIDGNLKFLSEYIGGAGVAGMATRGAERLSNMLNLSSETDRVQFRRNIQYLHGVATSLMNEHAGRPLAGDAKRLAEVIGGIDMGDTTANTIRSLEEVQVLYKRLQEDTLKRLEGTWQPPGRETGTTTTSPTSSTTPRWMIPPPEGHQ